VSRNAARLCGKRERGAMVSGRMRDDAVRCNRIAQRPDRVARSAKLESARALEILAFEGEFRVRQSIDAKRAQHGRPMRMRRDAIGGLTDG